MTFVISCMLLLVSFLNLDEKKEKKRKVSLSSNSNETRSTVVTLHDEVTRHGRVTTRFIIVVIVTPLCQLLPS